MNKFFILVCMIFCHVVDDYYLQGILAQMKQKEWWKQNAPDKKYRNDYLMALFMHSFSWAFMIMLPTVAYAMIHGTFSPSYCALLILNMDLHFVIDNEKANRRTINLIQDQFLHVIQILITWFCLIYI